MRRRIISLVNIISVARSAETRYTNSVSKLRMTRRLRPAPILIGFIYRRF